MGKQKQKASLPGSHPLRPILKKPDLWMASLLGVGAFIILFMFRAESQSGDSLSYAFAVRSGQGLFHPTHLLYSPIVRLFFLAMSQIFRTADVILAAQLHNIIWAVVSISLFYSIVQRLSQSRFLGVMGALFLLFTRGFWANTTQVEIYIPGLGCLLVIIAILILRRSFKLTGLDILMISLFFSLSVFYHQLNVLFCLPLGFLLISKFGRPAVKPAVRILLISTAVILAAYLLAFLTTAFPKNIGGFLKFCLFYVHYPIPSWASLKNLSLKGLGILFLSQSQGVVMVLKPWYLPGAILSALGFGLLTAWNFFHIRKHAVQTEIRIFTFIWLAVNYALLLWYDPSEPDLFISTLVPILLLILLTIKDLETKIGGRNLLKIVLSGFFIGSLVFMTLGNFGRNVRPMHASKSANYEEALALNSCAPQKSLIFAEWDLEQSLIFYFEKTGVLGALFPPLYFYQHLILPADFQVEGDRSLIFPVEVANPGKDLWGYDGFKNSAEWLKFIEWLFHFSYDEDRKLISCRTFEVLACGRGYFLLSPSPEAVDGLLDFFRRLDQELADRLGDLSRPFQSWLEKRTPS